MAGIQTQSRLPRDGSDAAELLARFGYGARGVVYLLLGGLTFASALWGGSEADSNDALASLLGQPFGRIMLGLIAIGLLGHVLWRLAQSILNADHQPGNAKGRVTRIGQFVSAIANVSIALTAASLAIGNGGGGGGSSEQSASAWLMQQPFGPWLVGLVGLVVVGVGAVQIWRGVAGKYKKWIRLPANGAGALTLICSFGLIARGALFVVVGGLFLFAAATVSPEQAGGLREALSWLHELPFGRVVYGAAALGLLAFGGYSITEALYRHVDAPDRHDIKRAVPGGA